MGYFVKAVGIAHPKFEVYKLRDTHKLRLVGYLGYICMSRLQ